MPLCEEILISEILSRVWTAALSAVDRAAGEEELEPIGRSILVGHLDCRNRVLHLIAAARGAGAGTTSGKLNRLRRVCERWTDLLLAPLATLADLSSLAHDPIRMRDMVDDFLDDQSDHVAAPRRTIFRASLLAAFPPSLGVPTLNADLNAQIAAGVLACFDLETLAATTAGPWLWHARAMNAANSAERWVGELME